MKRIQLIIMAAILISFTACKNDAKKDEEAVETEVVEKEAEKEAEDAVKTEIKELKSLAFALEPKSGSSASGKVGIIVENGMVTLEAQIFGLEEGTHAIHIHEKADCSSEDAKSSGGHWNPTFAPHGKWGDEAGYHKGDIGNFVADADGNATVDFATTEWCIGCDDETKNIVGKAVIVHQGVDDYTSQPSGAAGARVACTGIIE